MDAKGHQKEGGSLSGTWPEGQVCCSAWPFVQGIIKRAKLRGVMRHPGLRQTAARNPRFEKEVKFVPYFNLRERKAAGSIGDGRTVSVERHAVRCANIP